MDPKIEIETETKKTITITKEAIENLIAKSFGIQGRPTFEYEISGGIDAYDNQSWNPYQLHRIKVVSTSRTTS